MHKTQNNRELATHGKHAHDQVIEIKAKPRNRVLRSCMKPSKSISRAKVPKLQDKCQIKLKRGINTCSGVATCQNWRSNARNTSQNSINAAAWRSYAKANKKASSTLQLGVATWEAGVATLRPRKSSSFLLILLLL